MKSARSRDCCSGIDRHWPRRPLQARRGPARRGEPARAATFRGVSAVGAVAMGMPAKARARSTAPGSWGNRFGLPLPPHRWRCVGCSSGTRNGCPSVKLDCSDGHRQVKCALMNATAILALSVVREPHPAMVAPFVILLLAIALMPFIHKHHWENHYPKVSIALGLITVMYYIVGLQNGPRMLTSMIEYVGFMALIGSLFVIAGGIHINMTGRSAPTVNTGMLALGAILANLIGTTGASMLLIRPFLRINKYRVAPYHVVFFIFIVSNIGGALTPIGDPPLFLGYLKGVPFFWLLTHVEILLSWLLCIGALLLLFFIMDSRSFQRHKREVKRRAEDRVELEGT